MNKEILRSAFDDIKASEELKNRILTSMTNKSLPPNYAVKHYRQLIAGIASLILVASVAGVCFNYNVFHPIPKESSINFTNNESSMGGSGGDICEMFLSDGDMYYTDYQDKLLRFNSSAKAGETVSSLEVKSAALVFEDKGFIYYSNGSTIFQNDIGKNTSVPLISGENIGVNAVRNGLLIYGFSYKDTRGFFTEFEYHIFDLANQKDTVLFARSETLWNFLDFNGDTAIADASIKDDSGLFAIDMTTRTTNKLLDLRVHEGKIINGIFYYTSHDEQGLWRIALNGDGMAQIPLPAANDPSTFVDRITGYGDYLYVADYFNGENHIIQVNLQTHQTAVIADGLGRVWKLCTDGKTLYAYDTKSPSDKHGNITVIPLS